MINTHYRGWVEPLIYPMRLGVDETYQWVTDVQTSYDGTEYRKSLRGVPRKRVTFDIFTKDLQHNQAFVRLYRSFTNPWAVPMWMDATKHNGDIPISSTSITLPERNFWFTDESLALIYSSKTKWEVVDVENYDGQTLNLYAGTTYSHNSPFIVPISTGRIRGASRNNYKDMSTHGLILEVDDNFIPTYEIMFEDNEWEDVVLWNSEDYYMNGTVNIFASVANQYGREVLNRNVASSNGYINDNNLQANVLVFDNTRGLRQQISTWNNSKIDKTFSFVINGRRTIDYMRTWLIRLGGQYKELWIPSYGSELSVVSNTVTQTLDVTNFVDSDRKYVGIQKKDYTWFFSEITNKQNIGEGVTRLTIKDNFNLGMGEINQVTYAGVHRLNSDTLTVKWIDHQSASVEIPILEIEG